MKIVLICLTIVILLIIYLYNHLVKLNIRCKNAWSQIDNQLKRRYDLIPNLVEITKGYAKHESKVLVDIVNARNEAKTMSQIAKNSDEITNNVKNLLALAENYPDLKADKVFKNLQIELSGTEDKIAFARQFYNDSVQHYNTAIQIFPNNLLAKLMKYEEKEYFKVSDNEKELVKVKLWY